MFTRPAYRAFAGIRAFSTTPRAQLAKMQIIGRLAAEPELVHTSTGRDLVRYALGVTSGPRDNQTVSWYRITSFPDEGKQKDYILSLPKGTLLHCEARATMRTYEDPNEPGKKRSNLDLVQSSIEVLSRPRNLVEDEGAEEPAAAAAA